MAEIDSENFKAYFYERFELNNHWQAFAPVAKYLNSTKVNQRFNLLFSILQDVHEQPYNYQKVAAGLMMKVDAKCPLDVQQASLPVLNTLDLSIQEFPWFLAKRLGRDHVLTELDAIDQSNLDDSQKKRLETLIYWTQGFTDDRYEELRQRWSARIKG